jgi:hypothetical protein
MPNFPGGLTLIVHLAILVARGVWTAFLYLLSAVMLIF